MSQEGIIVPKGWESKEIRRGYRKNYLLVYENVYLM